MSYVTDVYIIAAVGEDEAVEWINDWLRDNDPRGQSLRDMSGDAGGQKWPQVTIAGAALNYAPPSLMTAFINAPWEQPDSVVIVWQDEDDDGPRAYSLRQITEGVAS